MQVHSGLFGNMKIPRRKKEPCNPCRKETGNGRVFIRESRTYSKGRQGIGNTLDIVCISVFIELSARCARMIGTMQLHGDTSCQEEFPKVIVQ